MNILDYDPDNSGPYLTELKTNNMKILFKSDQPTIIEAALKWQKTLNMDTAISYAELKPHHLGETPEYNYVNEQTGREICFINLTKEGKKYTVFKHDIFGIIIARED